MPGYTKKQLKARDAKLSNYVWCKLCRLYWHRRSFEKHLLLPEAPKKPRPIAVTHPAERRFLEFMAKTIVKRALEERAEKMRLGKPIEPAAHVPEETAIDDSGPESVTVEEAALRLGVSKEEILAGFEKEPFRLELR